MKSNMKTLAAAAALVIGLAGAGGAYAHGNGGSQGSMMGQGMMGQGGMMGQMNQMMKTCSKMMQGMMGHGMMGRGMKRHDFGRSVVPTKDLSVDDVRHFLEHRLARRGNKRLKVGEVKEGDEDAIIADIMTVDDSLVERLKVDRHTGRIERVE